MLQEKKILVGITGGIAAYKTLTLIRRLREEGAQVRVCLTQAAKQFVTPMTCAALSGESVSDALFDAQGHDPMLHITLAKWADFLLIAPATADVMARMAQGHADDLLTNVYLAYAGDVALAPAMNQQMWQHPATQVNVQVLQARGVRLWGPDEGVQACGDEGPGRMLEPEHLLGHVQAYFSQAKAETTLRGQRVLITAGPTVEAIDPVRCLTNHSSGLMAYALAEAAACLGATVTMVSGPCALPCPPGVTRYPVQSAREMFDHVKALVSDCDVFVGAAAVSDYRPVHVASRKLKKQGTTMRIECQQNEDIVAYVGRLEDPNTQRPFTVGFAAETEDVVANAAVKLEVKGCDMMVANEVGPGKGMHADQNEVTILGKDGDSITLPLQSKRGLAYAIWAQVMQHMAVAAR